MFFASAGEAERLLAIKPGSVADRIPLRITLGQTGGVPGKRTITPAVPSPGRETGFRAETHYYRGGYWVVWGKVQFQVDQAGRWKIDRLKLEYVETHLGNGQSKEERIP